MLRITVHENQESLTFQLEGRLAGAWVKEVEQCWQSTLARQRANLFRESVGTSLKPDSEGLLETSSKPILRVDLTGVTFIDDAGKACLAAMYGQGAGLVAADCLTRDIVAEICQGRSEPPDGSVTSRSRRR
jgi:hypothetical protein